MRWARFGKSEIKGLGEVTTPMLMSHLCNFLVTLCRYLIQLMFISSHSEKSPGVSPQSLISGKNFFPQFFP